jgi:glucokinase
VTTSLGVDIGGTKIGFCLVDAQLEARTLTQVPTALLRRGTTAFAADLAELVRAVAPPDIDRVGLTLNGVLDGDHIVYSSLMGGAVDFPLGAFLRERLPWQIFVDDDIHAMARAEAHLGAGQGDIPFAMLNLGTGIGVGYHDGGGVFRGAYAAGLISEQIVYVAELGEFRSLDRTVCGRGLRELALHFIGQPLDAAAVFARVRAGDEQAQKVVELFARQLGLAMQMISRFYHPKKIILNGSIKRAADLYLGRAVEVYEAGLGAAFGAEISVSSLDHAAERGALSPPARRDKR